MTYRGGERGLIVHWSATENPRVGGSIPPLGTILPEFQRVALWVALGLSEFVSMPLSARTVWR